MTAPKQSFYYIPWGGWRDVEQAWIYTDIGTPSGSNWESVHNIWVRDGGEWKYSHKTAHTKYTTTGGNITNWNVGDVNSSSGLSPVYTVPAGVHYLDVQILGQSGGAGGNIKTSGDSSSSRHFSTSWAQNWSGGYQYASSTPPGYTQGNTNWVSNYAYGGNGGSGGLWQGIIEVKPGDQFQGTWDKKTTPAGGQGHSHFYLPYNHIYQAWYTSGTAGPLANFAVGVYEQAVSGEAGGTINFGTYSDSGTNMNIVVAGGGGGVGGKQTVAAVSRNPWFWGLQYYLHGYTVTNLNGAAGANGSVTSQGGATAGDPPDNHLAGSGRFAEITHGIGVGNSHTSYGYGYPSGSFGTSYSGGSGYGGQIAIYEKIAYN
jgi:hypothetical protein